MIRLEHVAKAYKNTVIFRDLSLEIPTGASVAVTGYNGSGKSVLLKLIHNQNIRLFHHSLRNAQALNHTL